MAPTACAHQHLLGKVMDSIVTTLSDCKRTPWLNLLYRNRIDHASLNFRRNELTAVIRVDAIRLGTTYGRYDGHPQNELQGNEEFQYAIDTRLTRLWRTRFFGITPYKGTLSGRWGLRLIYEDECLFFLSQLARGNCRDRDFKPSNTFFRLGFKTLADVGVGF
jgi:hypothetical protein